VLRWGWCLLFVFNLVVFWVVCWGGVGAGCLFVLNLVVFMGCVLGCSIVGLLKGRGKSCVCSCAVGSG